MLVVVIPLLLGFLLCLRSHLLTFLLAVFTRSGENQGKSFHRNEVSKITNTGHILFVCSVHNFKCTSLLHWLVTRPAPRLLHIACSRATQTITSPGPGPPPVCPTLPPSPPQVRPLPRPPQSPPHHFHVLAPIMSPVTPSVRVPLPHCPLLLIRSAPRLRLHG